MSSGRCLKRKALKHSRNRRGSRFFLRSFTARGATSRLSPRKAAQSGPHHLCARLGGRSLMETMRQDKDVEADGVALARNRHLVEGVDGLLHDATRPSGRKPIPEDSVGTDRPCDVAAGACPALDSQCSSALSYSFNFISRSLLCPRFQDSTRSSGPRLHLNGRASLALWCSMYPPIAATQVSRESKTAFFSLCRTSFEKNPSTAFIHDAEVGVK